jgi:hypothetical protein
MYLAFGLASPLASGGYKSHIRSQCSVMLHKWNNGLALHACPPVDRSRPLAIYPRADNECAILDACKQCAAVLFWPSGYGLRIEEACRAQ